MASDIACRFDGTLFDWKNLSFAPAMADLAGGTEKKAMMDIVPP
jgi:hypothetical protein